MVTVPSTVTWPPDVTALPIVLTVGGLGFVVEPGRLVEPGDDPGRTDGLGPGDRTSTSAGSRSQSR